MIPLRTPTARVVSLAEHLATRSPTRVTAREAGMTDDERRVRNRRFARE